MCGEIVFVLHGFMASPCTRWWSAVLWCLTFRLAARRTMGCRGCWLGSDVSLRVELNRIRCISIGTGYHIAPVIANAADLWTCVILAAMPLEPRTVEGEPAWNIGLNQMLAA